MYTRNKEKVAMTTRKDKRGKSGRNYITCMYLLAILVFKWSCPSRDVSFVPKVTVSFGWSCKP